MKAVEQTAFFNKNRGFKFLKPHLYVLIVHCSAGTFLFDFEKLPENPDDFIDKALKAALVTNATAFFRLERGRAVVTNAVAVGINVTELFKLFGLCRRAGRATINRLALFGAGRVLHRGQNERVRRFRRFSLSERDFSANGAFFALCQTRF